MLIRQSIKEKEIHKEFVLGVLLVFPIILLLFGIIIGSSEPCFFSCYVKITKSPTILVTDFLALGGIGASFVNAAVIGFVNIYLLKHYKMKINGLLIAAFMTLLGFSFFGKNLINIIPFYLGGYVYTKYQRKHMRDVIVIIMFSTGLSPMISELMFSSIIPTPYNLLIGFIIGIATGFLIIPLSSQMLKFHEGYNLYNIGFTAGIIGTVFTSILRLLDKEVEPVRILYESYDLHIKLLLTCLFIFLVAIGLFVNSSGVKDLRKIFRYSGRTVTDFTYLLGYGVTFINMGIMGLSSLLLVTLLGGIVNGPVLAAIFTIVGFSAFGKHLQNSLPVVLGVLLAALCLGYDLSSTAIVISILFSTTIAPIAGVHGPVAGVIAGILHLALVTNIGIVHGGINLYNNGFAGGLVAGFLVPIIDAFKRGD
ncbi:DUF1576 domain-containing protein [Acidaminobacter sp. JC074]|uniref:DUF1576 domain-containing protein n=1 Tax=Acidaminobacter sp. JC074 TaxID=2530199 RepID=UPI001F0D04D0|nr:DUF1576 domain-containing protein [Acidaminobacter sp. JC074]MCH4887540.1 DUF1576 domain-containing protein [Acidaminobacter sp. JC074]